MATVTTEIGPPAGGDAHVVTGGGGVDLRVDETGTADERPILFVHGFSGSRLVWHEQLTSELQDDFRLVAVDLRGHGRSDKPEDAYTDAEHWAADIHAVVDEVALEEPILVGWSVGAGWIADYLSVYGTNDVAGVNVVGPRLALRDEELTTALGPDMLALLERGAFVSTDAAEATAGLEEFVSLWTADPLSPRTHLFLLGIVSLVPPSVRAGILSRTGTVAYDDVLADLEVPTLLSHGERDAVIPLEAGTAAVDLVPNARTSVYPGTGHMPFLEAPDRFNRELRAFADGL